MNIYHDVEDNHYRTYPDGDIASIDQMRELIENKNVSIVKLQQENKQLKDNWNKLKEYLENKIDKYSINLEYLSAERMTQIKNKMQELEKGDNNDKNNR